MAKTNRNYIQKPDITIDQRFSIPPGVSGLRYATDDDLVGQQNADTSDNENDDLEFSIPEDDDFVDEEEDNSEGDDLPVPTSIEVIDQVFNVAEDGTSSVDVIIEIPDMGGDYQVDMRVTRIYGTV